MPIRHSTGACALILLVAAFASTAAAGETGDPKRDLKSSVEQVRLDAIDRLAAEGGKSASSLIAGRLRDRSPAVRKAAASALGEIGDRTAIAKLLASLKPLKDDPETLSEVCRALGEIGAPAAVEPLAKLGNREISRNADLTRAVVEALGRIRDRRGVEELIQLLGTATPTYSSRTYSYGHPELVAPIREALRALTGQRLGAHQAWADWWRRVRKTYRLPKSETAALSEKVYRDDGYQFSIERPSLTRWGFSRPRGVLIRARFQGSRDEAAYGVLDVSARSATGYSPSTPAALADLYADRFSEEFKDIKEMEAGRKDRIGGRRAIYQRVLGMNRHGFVVEIRQWVVLYRGNLFTVRSVLSSGAAPGVRAELEGIIQGFRFLNR